MRRMKLCRFNHYWNEISAESYLPILNIRLRVHTSYSQDMICHRFSSTFGLIQHIGTTPRSLAPIFFPIVKQNPSSSSFPSPHRSTRINIRSDEMSSSFSSYPREFKFRLGRRSTRLPSQPQWLQAWWCQEGKTQRRSSLWTEGCQTLATERRGWLKIFQN